MKAEHHQNVLDLFHRIEQRDHHIYDYIVDSYIDKHYDDFSIYFKDDPEFQQYDKEIQEMYPDDLPYCPEQKQYEMQFDWCLEHPIEVLRYYYYNK